MFILVSKTTNASPDGISIREYRAGITYDMPCHLAEIFVSQSWGSHTGKEISAKENHPQNKMRETFFDKMTPKRRGRPPKKKEKE